MVFFGRLEGPFSFRFVMQPIVALIDATRGGLADWQSGRPPYFRTLFTHPEQRRALLKEGFKGRIHT